MALDMAHSKIASGREMLEKLTRLDEKIVHGLPKLRKRIETEIKFLTNKLKNQDQLEEKYVQCSNLGQLEALVNVATEVPDVTGVLKTFSLGGVEKRVVDVVADKDKKWIKVILRNPKALHMAFVMRGRKAVKPLDEVAEDFLICAEQNLVFYTPPKVEFWFCSGVSESLANCLEDLDVEVKGERIPDDDLGLPDYSVPDSDTELEECSSDDLSEEDDDNYNSKGLVNSCNTSPSHDIQSQDKADDQEPQKEIKTVNLDVTAMIAYVSATSNGQANFLFQDVFLSEQAEMERKNPVKKVLNDYFEGRDVIACQEAVDHFLKIINTIGGDGEKMRANELVSQLTVVPGQDVFEEDVKLCGKVRLLARIIFGTGEAHRAVTITSNRHFIRAVGNQGIRPAVFYHDPRALTEQKQDTAVPL